LELKKEIRYGQGKRQALFPEHARSVGPPKSITAADLISRGARL
jgi:hypothetical protein